jgi:hypothetical protein
MTVERDPQSANRRTALVLASIALVFFFGIMLKYVLTR